MSFLRYYAKYNHVQRSLTQFKYSKKLLGYVNSTSKCKFTQSVCKSTRMVY